MKTPKPTIKDKMQIICQYANQLLECSFVDARTEKITTTGEIVNMSSPNVLNISVGVNDYDFYLESDEVVILLKSLGSISEEHKSKLEELTGMQKQRQSLQMVLFDLNNGTSIICISIYRVQIIIEQVREWGYAIPYKNWSVLELVEFGIYKLID